VSPERGGGRSGDPRKRAAASRRPASPAAGERPRAGGAGRGPEQPPRRPGSAVVDFGIVLAALVVATVVAELAGAVDLGTALTFGILAFLAATMWVLLRRP
jgi:hypothetical protein